MIDIEIIKDKIKEWEEKVEVYKGLWHNNSSQPSVAGEYRFRAIGLQEAIIELRVTLKENEPRLKANEFKIKVNNHG